MSIKLILNRLLFPNHCTNEAYVKYLTKGGQKLVMVLFSMDQSFIQLMKPPYHM